MIKKFLFGLSLCLFLTSCPNPDDVDTLYPINYIKLKIEDKTEISVVNSTQVIYTNINSLLETPSIATNKSGESVIAWSDNSKGTKDVYARRLDANGFPKGEVFQVNTTSNNDQYLPSVAINDNGDFVIVWTTKSQDGDGLGVYGRRYDSNGGYQGNEFKVNTSTTGDQWIPKVAINNNSGFVIVWQSFGQDGNDYAIIGQKFTNRGVNVGYEFIINTTSRGSQEFPDISMDSIGNFTVVWSTNQNQLLGDQASVKYRDIYAKRFNKDGIATNQEFIVSTTIGEQSLPSVYMTDPNNVFFAWNVKEQNSGYHDIYARYFTGNQSKPASKVSTSNRADVVSKPAISMDSTQNSIVVWHNESGNIINSGLYAKKYDKNGNETKAEYKVNSGAYNLLQPSVSVDSNGKFRIVWKEF